MQRHIWLLAVVSALFFAALIGGLVNAGKSAPTPVATPSPTQTVTIAPDLSEQTRDTPGPPPTPFPVSAESKAKAAAFLARADRLYSGAQAIIGSGVPTDRTAVAEKVAPGTAYSDYQEAYRTFQSDVQDAPRSQDSMEYVYDNLAEFEEFAWSGVFALASCNGDDAHLNIMVAKAFLDEAHKSYHGASNNNWSPPDITDKVTDKDDCTDDSGD